MMRGYYFQQQLADLIKQEMKHNFCSVKIESNKTLLAERMGIGKGKGKGRKGQETETQEIPDKVVVIIMCRNTRDVLGEKGAKLRLLSHKVNGFFGFPPDFLQIYVERKERTYDSDSDDDETGRKGKGRGKKGKKGYSPEPEEAEEEPAVQKKVKQPKWKPPPEPRREIPEFDTEQWMACALRCAQLHHVLSQSKTFAPVKMLLGDPLRYAVRLWREHNLRASTALTRAREPKDPWATLGDWGDSVGDWGDSTGDWGAINTSIDWADPNDPVPNAPRPLSEAEKKAARAERFGATAAKGPGLVVRDFGSDEDVHLENLDARTASCADVLAQLQKVRTFAKGVQIGLVLLPSGRELMPDFQMSKIPAGETVNFMALASGW